MLRSEQVENMVLSVVADIERTRGVRSGFKAIYERVRIKDADSLQPFSRDEVQVSIRRLVRTGRLAKGGSTGSGVLYNLSVEERRQRRMPLYPYTSQADLPEAQAQEAQRRRRSALLKKWNDGGPGRRIEIVLNVLLAALPQAELTLDRVAAKLCQLEEIDSCPINNHAIGRALRLAVDQGLISESSRGSTKLYRLTPQALEMYIHRVLPESFRVKAADQREWFGLSVTSRRLVAEGEPGWVFDSSLGANGDPLDAEWGMLAQQDFSDLSGETDPTGLLSGMAQLLAERLAALVPKGLHWAVWVHQSGQLGTWDSWARERPLS